LKTDFKIIRYTGGKMKRIARSGILIALILSTAICVNGQESEINKKIADLSKSLTRSYRQNSEVDFRQNLAILNFENISDLAREKRIGEAVAELLQSYFSESIVFNVIERKRLDKIIEEQQLQLSGLTDEASTIQFGQLLNTDVLLMGSVTELGDVFNINASMVNVQNGKIIAGELVSVKITEMIAVAHQLEMAYVEKMGIGIGLSTGATFSSNEPSLYSGKDKSTIIARPVGIDFRYRFSETLMLSIGINSTFGDIIYADVDGTSLPWFGNPGYPFTGQIIGSGSGFGFPIEAYYVLNLGQKLNAFINGGIEISQLNITYDLKILDPQPLPLGFEITELPEGDFTTLLASVGVGFEYFISPRLALSTKIQYKIGTMKADPFEGHDGMFWINVPEDLKANLSGPSVLLGLGFYF